MSNRSALYQAFATAYLAHVEAVESMKTDKQLFQQECRAFREALHTGDLAEIQIAGRKLHEAQAALTNSREAVRAAHEAFRAVLAQLRAADRNRTSDK